MEEFENLTSDNSFSELYNAYYFFQLKNNEVPLLKKFTDIKKGIMERLEDKIALKEGKSSKRFELFQTPGIVPSKNFSGEISIKKEEENLIEYEGKISNEISNIKSKIKDKIVGITQSGDFLINLDVLYEKRVIDSDKYSYHSESDKIGLGFNNLNLDTAFGLYYILHDDIPEKEFFNQKNGWGLRISQFPEVNDNIEKIRKKHGIKTPRALERTLEEEGRREANKKLAAKLNYAVVGERELFEYLNRFSELNFSIDIRKSKNQMIGINSVEDINYIATFEYDKFNKNFWTGRMEVVQSDYKHELKDIFFNDSPRNMHIFREELKIEEICTHVIEKFADKGLIKNLRIRADKKYN